MKIIIVSSKDEIRSLDSKEKLVHFAFRPSNKDIFELVKACPKLKALHVPQSYMRTISKTTKMYLEMQEIALLEGDVWGHRKDIDEYYEIKPEVIERIKELKSEGLADSDILNRMVRGTRLSRDLLEFLMKGM
ncbi:MAG: hypothetical protein CVV34_00065 [Methanomicrobiales archaeon HGW-Methanomicrobiales-5]|nr:MAG: hypothetical protein CVV34_00065 [Methanomicrobiales archaeon HGW-Methanomicrobiales-5]